MTSHGPILVILILVSGALLTIGLRKEDERFVWWSIGFFLVTLGYSLALI